MADARAGGDWVVVMVRMLGLQEKNIFLSIVG